ncbi:MAG: FkbM family methyltransferase [Chthoniobacterales bacterium]
MSRVYQQIRSLIDPRYRRAYRSLRNLPRTEYRTLIDAGANRGTFTDAFLQVYSPSRVVLVEPIPALAEGLRRRFSPRAGFSVVAAALADRSGEADFQLNESLDSSSLFRINPRNVEWFGRDLKVTGTLRVPTLTLTQLLEEQRLQQVDLLKLDLQGAERLVLVGSEAMLPRIRVIYTEVFFERLYGDAWLFWEMNEFLAARGFKLCGISNIAHGRNNDLLQANAIFWRAGG